MRGRKARGPEIVHDLEHGSELARQRAEMILRVLSRERTVEQAAAELDLTPQRLHELRTQGILGLIDSQELQPVGRPRKQSEPAEVTALRQENARLKQELEAARLREEIDLVLPAQQRRTSKKKRGPGRAERPGGDEPGGLGKRYERNE